MTNPDAKCMHIKYEEGPPDCLPCEYGKDNPSPCPTVGGVYGLRKVTQCKMACEHQNVISKVSPCTDTSGYITTNQCFSKGKSALTTCMWTEFVTAGGDKKAYCGPCSVMGIGKIPCSAPGVLGPDPGSSVSLCLSMCDGECWCNGTCRPTPLPPPVVPAPVPMKILGIPTTDKAPQYFAVPVDPPYGIQQYHSASEVGARSAGWPDGTNLVPDTPISIYGGAPYDGPTLPPTLKVVFGPAPPGIPGVPPPGYGVGTAPPMSRGLLLQTNEEKKRNKRGEIEGTPLIAPQLR